MNPLVSVIIPTYNCARWIEATLASVLAQSHRPLEIIVVDDGSSDGTAAIAQSQGPLVRVLAQENQGVCRARNRGFVESRGEFVCFLDHDDHWFPWKLRRQLEAFDAHPDTGVVFTAFEFWSPIDGAYPDAIGRDPGDASEPPIDPDMSGWVYHQFLLDCWALTSTAMIRRNVFAASGGFDVELPYSEDWDMWLRLSRHVPFVKLDRVSTLYRQHPTQGSRAVREVDYRTRLLWNARRRWGLASQDGRSVSSPMFDRNIATYHMQFGLHHLRHGTRAIGLHALAKAWHTDPGRIKYAALLVAGALGWKPKP